MANQNNMGAQNAAMYTGMNNGIMPAGNFADLQHLMQGVENLSGWLEQNRQDWAQVQEGIAKVERLQGRLAQNGQLPLINGDSQPVPEPEQPTVAQLSDALAKANLQIDSMRGTYNDHVNLQRLYEETLSDTTERIRQYCFEQQNHIIALHQHYTTLLSQSRSETVEAQLTHQAWQASLQRVSENVRGALKARQEEGTPYKRRIAALKEENRVLRKMAGWEPPVDSGDEDEVHEELTRGRVSQVMGVESGVGHGVRQP
ncbi:hypothetical protein Slin15195_G006220 [Septoria linicola]|uniref:Uncharacterized protein n=1 Tax=Septoria linicola TaxID=215465 RepID=A0A9Q9AI25_9PEZI|nr:hypothetical protein Slin14017_G006240 [Septoria linicola]USW47303.1 hypothetical protein Slin15195_G006220 [Septoria linicola]